MSVLPQQSLIKYLSKKTVSSPLTVQKQWEPSVHKRTGVTPTTWLILDAVKYDTAFLEAIVSAERTIFKLGIGKTVYALKTISKVYGNSWNMLKDYVIFMPQEFLRLLEKLIDRNERIPAIIWDDAGFWLGRQRWMNKFVIAVREHLNVIRTHIAAILFTAPKYKELAKGIRDNIDTMTMIRIHRQHVDPRQRISYARCYYGVDDDSLFWNNNKPSPWAEHYFSVYWKDYPQYLEKRKQYVEIGYNKLKNELKQIAEEAAMELEEIASKYDPSRKKEVELAKLEELAENLDLEDLREMWGY